MVYSREFNTSDDDSGWTESSTYYYKPDEHPLEFDFTFDEVTSLYHEAGSAGTAYVLNIQKDLGNGRTRQFYGIHIHVEYWLRLFQREMDRARQGLEPTRYLAQRARHIYWVNPSLCNPVIDSSQYTASQKANQKKMVA